MKTNKRGFTLIELLAVIVIIAIISVITVPIVLNIIEQSKKGTAKDSAYGYVESVNRLYYSKSLKDEDDVGDGIYTVSELKTIGVSITGSEPSDGWVQIENNEVVAYSLKFGDYVITKYRDTDLVVEKRGDIQLDEVTKQEMERKTKAKNIAISEVSSLSGLTEIKNVTDGWVAFIDGNVEAYSIKVLVDEYQYIVSLMNGEIFVEKGTEVASKIPSICMIVEYLGTQYISGLTIPDSENVLDVSESGYLKDGYVQYKFNNSVIILNDYSLKYEIDGVIRYANYDKNNDRLIVGEKANQLIAIGASVNIGNEGFYIVDINNNNVTLFAKTCLMNDSGTYRQIVEGESCLAEKFSNTKYWVDGTTGELKSQYVKSEDTGIEYWWQKPPYVYDSNSLLYDIINSYSQSLSPNASGRLWSTEEARQPFNSILYTSMSYWTGTSNGYGFIISYNSEGIPSNGQFDNYNYYSLAIRPVIIIPIEDIL